MPEPERSNQEAALREQLMASGANMSSLIKAIYNDTLAFRKLPPSNVTDPIQHTPVEKQKVLDLALVHRCSTPSFGASSESLGVKELVKTIEYGGNPNHITSDSKSLLELAIEADNLLVAKALMDKGAKVINGKTGAHASQEQIEALDELVKEKQTLEEYSKEYSKIKDSLDTTIAKNTESQNAEAKQSNEQNPSQPRGNGQGR